MKRENFILITQTMLDILIHSIHSIYLHIIHTYNFLTLKIYCQMINTRRLLNMLKKIKQYVRLINIGI